MFLVPAHIYFLLDVPSTLPAERQLGTIRVDLLSSVARHTPSAHASLFGPFRKTNKNASKSERIHPHTRQVLTRLHPANTHAHLRHG